MNLNIIKNDLDEQSIYDAFDTDIKSNGFTALDPLDLHENHKNINLLPKTEPNALPTPVEVKPEPNALPTPVEVKPEPLEIIKTEELIIKEETSVYSCEMCTYQTQFQEGLARHVEQHSTKKTYKCKYCEFTCRNCNEFQRHLRPHLQKKALLCCECSYRCSLQQCLVQHMYQHLEQAVLKCGCCDFKTSDNDELTQHAEAADHIGKMFTCNKCGYAVSRRQSFVMHLIKQHCARDKFKCNKCRFVAMHKEIMVLHLESHALKVWQCSRCVFKTSDQASFKQHLTRWHWHKCQKCLFKTKTYNDLLIHEQAIHLGELLRCGNCAFTSPNFIVMKQHLTTHLVDETPP